MARNRTIYQSDSVYAGPSPATGAHFNGGIPGVAATGTTAGTQVTGINRVNELYRIQSANYSYNIPRTDVNQFNQLASIDRVILEQPTVSMDFSWIQNNMYNEKCIGLWVSSGALISAISGILNKVSDERNYFVLTVPEGNDAAGFATGPSASCVVWGIGNAFLTSYTAEASVGNFPTASVNIEALNMKVDIATTGQLLPAVNPLDGTAVSTYWYSLPTGKQSADGLNINTSDLSISALRPGDITLSLGTEDMGPSFSDLKVQNYSLSFDLAREPLQKLGSKYAFSREITFPVTVTLSVTADIGDVASGNMVNVINNDPNRYYNPSIAIKKPNTSTNAVYYEMKNAKLDSMEVTSSVGPNKSATFAFSCQLGGPQATGIGLFMSGIAPVLLQ